MKKTVQELLNEMEKAQVITEGHKLLILRAVEREKINYAINELNDLKTKLTNEG